MLLAFEHCNNGPEYKFHSYTIEIGNLIEIYRVPHKNMSVFACLLRQSIADEPNSVSTLTIECVCRYTCAQTTYHYYSFHKRASLKSNFSHLKNQNFTE